jgi:hypothetical protein
VTSSVQLKSSLTTSDSSLNKVVDPVVKAFKEDMETEGYTGKGLLSWGISARYFYIKSSESWRLTVLHCFTYVNGPGEVGESLLEVEISPCTQDNE